MVDAAEPPLQQATRHDDHRQQPPLPPGPIILISLKLYFDPSRTLSYIQSLISISSHIRQELSSSSSSSSGITIPDHQQQQQQLTLAFIPDFLSIHPCSRILSSVSSSSSWPLPLLLGAQDCFWEDSGPYTGEISPLHLKRLGCSIVELGHAERRRLFGETDAIVAKKALAAVRNGLIPLVCIGELSAPGAIASTTASVGQALDEIRPQVTSILGAVPAESTVIFAYEPVWAIGQPKPAGVAHVGAVVQGIWGLVRQEGRDGRNVKIVYGGSAGPGLWSGRSAEDGVGLRRGGGGLDGMFLGRFAHVPEKVEEVLGEVVDAMWDVEGLNE